MAVVADNIQDFEIILSEPQEAVMAARTRLILDMGGQGAGKSQNIGFHSGLFASTYPELRQFIAANTLNQLNGATLNNAFKVWRTVYGMTMWDAKRNPRGNYVINKAPPAHWKRLHEFGKYDNIISFWNGAIIMVGSLENYKAHDGKEFCLAHLDETKDTRREAVEDVILGRMRQPGLYFDVNDEIVVNVNLSNAQAAALGLTAWNPLYIHTSPALGIVDWLNEMFLLTDHEMEIKERLLRKEHDYFYQETEQTTSVIYSAFHNKDNLAPGFLESQLKVLSEEKALKLVYGFPFSKTGGEWFNEFSRLKHTGDVPYLPHLHTIQTTWDFNVMPYMTCLLAQMEYITRYLDSEGEKHADPQPGYMPLEVLQIRFFKEYCFGGTQNSVDAIGKKFAADFPQNGQIDINYYGDAQGNNRIEGLGVTTRFKLVEQAFFAYTHSSSKKAGKQNINPLVRRDLFNDIFAGRIKEVEIIIDRSCKELIKDCDKVKLGPEGKVKKHLKDKETKEDLGEEFGHTSDAMEYLVSEQDVCKQIIKNRRAAA